jgi:hypothetical protein
MITRTVLVGFMHRVTGHPVKSYRRASWSWSPCCGHMPNVLYHRASWTESPCPILADRIKTLRLHNGFHFSVGPGKSQPSKVHSLNKVPFYTVNRGCYTPLNKNDAVLCLKWCCSASVFFSIGGLVLVLIAPPLLFLFKIVFFTFMFLCLYISCFYSLVLFLTVRGTREVSVPVLFLATFILPFPAYSCPLYVPVLAPFNGCWCTVLLLF